MSKRPRCRDIERLILEREESRLTAGDEKLIGDHLRVCSRCRDFEAALAGMREELPGMIWPSPPAGLDRRVLCRARGVLAGEERGPGEARQALPRPVLAAAAALTVLLAVWSTAALADIGPGQILSDLPFAAKAALLLIAQNALMLFFAPVALRAGRPWAGGPPGGPAPNDADKRRSL